MLALLSDAALQRLDWLTQTSLSGPPPVPQAEGRCSSQFHGTIYPLPPIPSAFQSIRVKYPHFKFPFFFPQPQFLTVSYSTRHRLKLSAQITLSVCVSNSAKHLTLISHRLFKCHREKLQSIEMLNPIYIHFNDSDSIIYVVSKICFPNSFECFEHSPLPPQIILQV